MIDCLGKSDCDAIYITTISSDVYNFKDSDKIDKLEGLYLKANANNEKGEEIDVVKTVENYKLYINNETIDINYDLYKIYKDRNINVYKKNDECFKEKCWISDNFDFDLTQNYRRFNVYQGKNFYDNVCEINDEYEEISYVLNCIKSNDRDLENGFLKILTEKDPYDSKHVDNNIF